MEVFFGLQGTLSQIFVPYEQVKLGVRQGQRVIINRSSAEKFEGKKQSSCLNVIVSLTSAKAGISMEPIQRARAAGRVPATVFIRKFVEQRRKSPLETWELPDGVRI